MPNFENRGPPRGASDPDKGSQARRYIEILLERFPHVTAASLQLLERSEPFHEICEEYEACVEVAERLERHGSDEAMLREYRALRLRLEGELLRYISQVRSSGGSP